MIQEWKKGEVLFSENDRVDHYFYLLEGSIHLYQQLTKNGEEKLSIIDSRNSVEAISESFISTNLNRHHTAIAHEKINFGFRVSKQAFSVVCSSLIRDYKILKSYLASFTGVHEYSFLKYDVYGRVSYERKSYSHMVEPGSSVYIIVEGEVEMKLVSEVSQSVRPGICCYRTLHEDLTALKLCERDCIGLENYYQNFDFTIRYQVSSSEALLLQLTPEIMDLLKVELATPFSRIYEKHREICQKQAKNHSKIKLPTISRPTHSRNTLSLLELSSYMKSKELATDS